MSRENAIGKVILDAAFLVHEGLGPGLMESVYEAALADELTRRGLRIRRQVPIEAYWRGQPLGVGFKADLIVEDLVLIELKAVSKLADVHFRQVVTYLKLTRLKLGYLLNFDVAHLGDGGIRRLVNGLQDE
jgi:GxxExxY protein